MEGGKYFIKKKTTQQLNMTEERQEEKNPVLHQRKSLGQAPVLPQAHDRQLWV